MPGANSRALRVRLSGMAGGAETDLSGGDGFIVHAAAWCEVRGFGGASKHGSSLPSRGLFPHQPGQPTPFAQGCCTRRRNVALAKRIVVQLKVAEKCVFEFRRDL